MKRKRTNKKYYFSVEGQTEMWYLKRLEYLINNNINSRFNVCIYCKVPKDPIKFVKNLKILSRTSITHLVDYESNNDEHVSKFTNILDKLKKSKELGKQITYNLGYSNLTFELWMILHKSDCNCSYTNRLQYLKPLNSAYNEKFKDLDDYKKETNFKRILNKVTLDDVKDAIKRSRNIMDNNARKGYKMQTYKDYKYYKENPSLSIWESVNKILNECGI